MTRTHSLNTDSAIMWFDDFSEPGQETNDYRFLSNFYLAPTPIVLAGLEFMTGEHAFQAFKAATRHEFRLVREALSPGSAKSYGRTIKLRSDWESVKYDVMAAVVRAKFAPGREEAWRLLDTGDRLLVEGTYWSDEVWGTNLHRWDGEADLPPGRNWLGTLLMARRSELRANEVCGAPLPGSGHNILFAMLEGMPL